MKDELTLHPIAYLKGDFTEKFGVPRQSGRVKELRSEVIFEKEYSPKEAFRELDSFSHLWLLWGFSENNEKENGDWSPTVRPPRLGGNKRVGVFASRSPNRPNPIGLSLVKIEGISFKNGVAVLEVSGADLVNGTPIYDVKPYLPTADHAECAAGGYAEEHLNDGVTVDFPAELLERIPPEKRAALIGSLKDDPRPSYKTDPQRIYGMSFAGFQISFTVENGVLHVKDLKKDRSFPA